MNESRYLKPTALLDYQHPRISRLIEERGWRTPDEYSKIGAVYSFVKDEILFGYNASDAVSASQILHDGYGQCNTKSTLLAALLRGVEIPTRIHAFGIHKKVQQGVVPAVILRLASENLIHTWTEVLCDGTWSALEGCILDREYLSSVQRMNKEAAGPFCGYAVAVDDFTSIDTDWRGRSTFIQKGAITKDFGIFDAPDDVYEKLGENTTGIMAFMFRHVIRHLLNRKTRRIRQCEESITKQSAATSACSSCPDS
jgi:hypothetical protein